MKHETAKTLATVQPGDYVWVHYHAAVARGGKRLAKVSKVTTARIYTPTDGFDKATGRVIGRYVGRFITTPTQAEIDEQIRLHDAEVRDNEAKAEALRVRTSKPDWKIADRLAFTAQHATGGDIEWWLALGEARLKKIEAIVNEVHLRNGVA